MNETYLSTDLEDLKIFTFCVLPARTDSFIFTDMWQSVVTVFDSLTKWFSDVLRTSEMQKDYINVGSISK